MVDLPDDFASHPARDASLASMRAVESGDRAAWLALFAEDATVEDPIGPSPFDPEGLGHHGSEAIAAFYDTVIAPNHAVRFRIVRSHAGGEDEVANVGTITTVLPGGSLAVEADVVVCYRVNADGKVVSLRAFWEMDRVRIDEVTTTTPA